MTTTILNSPQPPGQQIHGSPTERDALLPKSKRTNSNSDSCNDASRPFFKPNLYWVVPFWLLACFSRGMTLAPRVEVYTHLACAAYEHQLHGHPHAELHPPPQSFLPTNASSSSGLATFAAWQPYGVTESLLFVTNDQTAGSFSVLRSARKGREDKTISRGPSKACLTDPTVQKYAARLQTAVILIMGTLSAITTGWWGSISDRFGRTKVMAVGLLGYLFTDLMFVIVARNARWLVPFGGHHILILGPIMEGLAGGFTTVTAAVNSYVSDVTPHGSRSDSFSKMQGILFIGVAAGPAFSSVLLKWTTPDILVIFSVGVLISFLNALYALFIMPESLTDEIREERERKRKAEMEEHVATHPALADMDLSWWARMKARLAEFLEPAALFIPQGNDWRLTLVAVSLFTCFLTVGLYPLKLLYAEHRFGWTSVEMGSYLTIIGSLRAAHLLVIIPTAIKVFKPTVANPTETTANIPASVPPEVLAAAARSPTTGTQTSSRHSTPIPGVPSRIAESDGPHQSKQVLADVRFDLNLARLSLLVDAMGYFFVVFVSNASSRAFVLATLLSAFGSGSAPAIQSAALCMLKNPSQDSGKLFGAFSMIQAIAAFIISPLVFGLMYSETVKTFPEAMFLCGGILLAFSCVALIFIRPAAPVKKKKRPIRRGRSTRTKVLGGSVERTGFVRHQPGPSGLSNSIGAGYGTEDEV